MHENHRAVVFVNEGAVFTVETESFFSRGHRSLVATDAGQSFKACPRCHLVRRRAALGFGLQTGLAIRRAFGRLGARRPYIRWDSQPNPDTSLQKTNRARHAIDLTDAFLELHKHAKDDASGP